MMQQVTQAVSVETLVGANIKELRREREWNQTDLAEKLKPYDSIHQRFQVKDIELGNRNVTVQELFALAHVFDVPLWRFYAPTEDTVDKKIRMGEVEIPLCEYFLRIVEASSRDSGDRNFKPDVYALDLWASLRVSKSDSPHEDRLFSAAARVGSPWM
jgi:transcriptional regulator with XRE-family HTH domain